MPNTTYTWLPNGRDLSRPCECGGTLRGWSVDPPRKVYLNHVVVCDNPACEEQVVHEGTDRERRGRRILLLG